MLLKIQAGSSEASSDKTEQGKCKEKCYWSHVCSWEDLHTEFHLYPLRILELCYLQANSA